MSLTKKDLQAIGSLLDSKLDKQTRDICGFINDNVVSQFDAVYKKHEELERGLQANNSKLADVTTTQRQIIAVLQKNDVLSTKDAKALSKLLGA